jgi:Ankyrin repeat
MSLLRQAIFMATDVLWKELIDGCYTTHLPDLLKKEDQQGGPENLLSKSLYGAWDEVIASYCWYIDRIQFIARNMSRVNEYDPGGYTPLMRAVRCGHVEVIDILLQRVPLDVDIDASSKDDRLFTVSHCAMIQTSHPKWNHINGQVIKKYEWHKTVYHPSFTRIIQDFAADHLIDELGSIILSFIFQNGPSKKKQHRLDICV